MSATPHTTADRIEMPRALARLLEWARPRRSALAWIALGVMLVATGAFLVHESRGAGVGALLALDRRDRAGDVAASLLLALSLASSGVGIPVALGVIVDVLGRRGRSRELWILAAPLILYGIWWLAYQTSQTSHW